MGTNLQDFCGDSRLQDFKGSAELQDRTCVPVVVPILGNLVLNTTSGPQQWRDGVIYPIGTNNASYPSSGPNNPAGNQGGIASLDLVGSFDTNDYALHVAGTNIIGMHRYNFGTDEWEEIDAANRI
jgi:hypothetical protein